MNTSTKLLTQSLLGIFLLQFSINISAFSMQPRGHIQNDSGKKCTYKQTVNPKATYFHETLTSKTATMTFDDPTCMGDSGMGLEINKMMINNVISRWYSHSDANFKTKSHQLYKTSMMQKKGKCMQSAKYPIIGITVDYIIKNNSIVKVLHGQSAGGCKK